MFFPEKIDGKFVALRRPMGWVGAQYGTTGPSIWISSSEDMVTWSTPELLAKPQNAEWEGGKIGAASPPVRTDKGWLLLYHGEWSRNKFTFSRAAIFVNIEAHLAEP